jgi:hypothetical protein
VLATIVGFFGSPAFDPRYQKEIDEEDELFERFQKEDEENKKGDDEAGDES